MRRAPDADHEARLERRLREDFPLYDFIGLEVRCARNGIYRCYVPHRASNLNHIDTIHAGIQWSASEVVGGVVILSLFEGTPLFAVVKKVSIDFIRPARSGIVVEAACDETTAARMQADFARHGEAELSLQPVVFDDEGVEVATADAHYLVRRPRPK